MKRNVTISVIVIMVLFVLVAPGLAGPPAGSVVIEGTVDLSSDLYIGTFEVTEGENLLGCSSGTFVDFPAGSVPPTPGRIAKVFSCADGGTGTFTANFQPLASVPGPGDRNGHWNFTGATGDFVGLHGQGDFSAVFDTFPPTTISETISGVIHYEP